MSDKVTIGVPVYNGEQFLRGALDALIAQDHPHIEIIISDNASTDGTQAICREYENRYANVRYHRNKENIGPSGNFQKVLSLAKGDYFMWAAHDDSWSTNYVSSLLAQLQETPTAVLATPLTKHVHDDLSDSKHSDDRPAPGKSRLANLRRFYKDHACTWIYGLYRTEWVKSHVAELDHYVFYGGDMLWMVDIMLRFDVVGSEDAVISKRVRKSSFTPKDPVADRAAWKKIFRQLTHLSWHRPPSMPERLGALIASWRYVFRKHIRKGGPLTVTRKIADLIPFSQPVTQRKAA